MEKRGGASTQPCLVPLVTGNGSDYPHTHKLLASISSWKDLMIFWVKSSPCRMFQRPPRFTVSNAFVRLMNTMCTSILVLLSAFFLNLPRDKVHVCGSSASSKPTL